MSLHSQPSPMADMMEYYQQITELKKAVRERELHRLELERQSLLCTQKRERRHEDFKDKIRDIQRELTQREMEASQNFQSLLARVEAIRKEHNLLAAHTDQLRHRKLQYEMSLKNANPILHTTPHHDLSGIYSSDNPAWTDNFHTTSTPAAKAQRQYSSLPPQPAVSPIHLYDPATTTRMYMDRHQPQGLDMKLNQHQPVMTPRTRLTMQSNSLREEPLHHTPMVPHPQQGSSIRTPSVHNQIPHVDYAILQTSREQLSYEGVMPHPQNLHVADKTLKTYNHPSHDGHTIPYVSREPDIHSHSQGYIPNIPVAHTQPPHGSYNIPHTYRELPPHTGMVSQTEGIAAITPAAYNPPSLTGYSIPDYSRSGGQSHTVHQPARDSLEYNRSMTMDDSLGHTTNALVTDTPSHSSSSYPQSVPHQITTDVKYYNSQPQSILQPHHHPGTNTHQTNGHMPSDLPKGYPSSNYSQGKLPSENSFESEYVKPQKNLSHDSPIHDPPYSNNTPHPELNAQYDKGLNSPPTDTYKPRSGSLVTREAPERDGTVPQAYSSMQSTVDQVPSNSREERLIRTPTKPNVEDKARGMFSPREGYRERTENDGLMRDITRRMENTDLSAQQSNSAPILKDSEQNNVPSPERIHEDRISPIRVKNDSMDDAASQVKPLLESSQGSVEHENNYKPNQARDIDDVNQRLDPFENTANIPHKDTSRSNDDARLTPHTHKTEIEEKDINSHKEFSPSKHIPVTEPAKPGPIHTTESYETPKKEIKAHDRQSSSSETSQPTTSPLIDIGAARPTSPLPPKGTPLDLEDSDTDFFDQNSNLTATAAYKSLVGGSVKGRVTGSEQGEGQVSSKPLTSLSSPSFKSFTSSIPSLRPAPPDTDTDSMDSVEAAIQTAMKKRESEPRPESRGGPALPQSPLKQEAHTETDTGQVKESTIKPGIDKVPGKKTSTAAVPINIDSECESYEVSGGGEASDEDDFDFYDKF